MLGVAWSSNLNVFYLCRLLSVLVVVFWTIRTCLLYESDSLSLYLHECCLIYIWSVYSPQRVFALYLLTNTESTTWGKEEGTRYRIP